jgi:hypothetical protein
MELQKLDATAASTILLRKHSLPFTSFFSLLKRKHYIPAAVAFVSILSQFFVVTLSGLPYRAGQTRSEFRFCAITSLFILAMIIIMIIVVNIWRHSLPELPRKPDTVAAVLSYVAGAQFCADFDGLENASVKERDRRVIALGKKYGFGIIEDTNKAERWMVDEVSESAQQEYYAVSLKVPGHSRNASATGMPMLRTADGRQV